MPDLRLLTNNMPLFFFFWQEVFIQLHTCLSFFFFFFCSINAPPSNPHTHPPTQFSLLAWCLTRCHLKVRESSKVGATLLYFL